MQANPQPKHTERHLGDRTTVTVDHRKTAEQSSAQQGHPGGTSGQVGVSVVTSKRGKQLGREGPPEEKGV